MSAKNSSILNHIQICYDPPIKILIQKIKILVNYNLKSIVKPKIGILHFLDFDQCYDLHLHLLQQRFKQIGLFTGLGFANFYVSIMVALYYNMILAWTIYYTFASFTSELPWASCGQEFNSECETFVGHLLEICWTFVGHLLEIC
jgi:hypothetical protein